MVAIVAVAAVVPLVGLGWFVVYGPGELEDTADTGIPAYMRQSAELGPSHGILVIEGDVESGLTWSVERGDGLTVGEDEVVGLMASDDALDRDVQTLVSAPEEEAAVDAAGPRHRVRRAAVARRRQRRRRPRRDDRPRAGQRRGPVDARLARRPNRSTRTPWCPSPPGGGS